MSLNSRDGAALALGTEPGPVRLDRTEGAARDRETFLPQGAAETAGAAENANRGTGDNIDILGHLGCSVLG